MKQALGLLEVRGLASAVSAADVMTKSAAVELLGVEKAKGSGWMTVKVVGDVGAVKASVEAGEASARHDGSFVSSKVIPRPGQGIAEFFLASDYGVKAQPKAKEAEKEVKIEAEPVKVPEELKAEPEPEKVEQQAEAKKEQRVEQPAVPVKNQPAPTKGSPNSKKPPSKGGKK